MTNSTDDGWRSFSRQEGGKEAAAQRNRLGAPSNSIVGGQEAPRDRYGPPSE